MEELTELFPLVAPEQNLTQPLTERLSGHGTDFGAVCELLVVSARVRCGGAAQQGESLLCGDH